MSKVSLCTAPCRYLPPDFKYGAFSGSERHRYAWLEGPRRGVPTRASGEGSHDSQALQWQPLATAHNVSETIEIVSSPPSSVAPDFYKKRSSLFKRSGGRGFEPRGGLTVFAVVQSFCQPTERCEGAKEGGAN